MSVLQYQYMYKKEGIKLKTMSYNEMTDFLTKHLVKIKNEYGQNKVVEWAKTDLKDYLGLNKVNLIMKGHTSISGLTEEELYLIAKFFVARGTIKPYILNEFEKEIINRAENLKTDVDISKKLNDVLTIKALFAGDDQTLDWIGAMSYQDIYNNYQLGKLVCKRVVIDTKAVKSIANKMKNNEYISDLIVLNLENNSENEID